MLSGYPEHREALRALGVAVSAGFAVGQRVRHSRRRGGWPLDIWKADRSGARGSTELDAVDLDVVALTRALKHVVESAAGVAERIGPVGDDDRRLELHTGSIARRLRQLDGRHASGFTLRLRTPRTAPSSGEPCEARTRRGERCGWWNRCARRGARPASGLRRRRAQTH